MFSDEQKSAESADQRIDEAPVKRRAKKRPAGTKSAEIESDHRSEASKKQARSKRGPGRPRGAKNKLTIERERIRKQLEREKLGPIKIKVIREPKEILLESANYFWARAEFLSNHARKLANEDASTASIDAIMEQADRQLLFACQCAEKAAPYYHAKVSGGPTDGEFVAYVARLPSPAQTSEEWAATSAPPGLQTDAIAWLPKPMMNWRTPSVRWFIRDWVMT